MLIPKRMIVGVLTAAVVGSCALSGPVRGPAPQSIEQSYIPDPDDYDVEPWIEQLDVPWSLAFLPPGRALVSERPGTIRLVRNGVLEHQPYAVLRTAEGDPNALTDIVIGAVEGGEGGLMGLAIHPGFPDPPFIYAMLTYRTRDGGDANRVIRLRDEGDRASVDRVIIDDIPASTFHNGGRIAFGPDGMLYVATGDASKPEFAQDLGSLAGKILRLTPDGGIPDDNPFPGSAIYSYGHRNPQGLAWHPDTGDLFASEHGPSGEYGLFAHDEINVIEPGRNYGWPRVVGAPGDASYTDPIVVWTEEAFPPGGIAFFDGALFVATMNSQTLVRIDVSQGGDGYRVERISHLFAGDRGSGRFGRLRDAVVGPDGALYFATSNRDGRADPDPLDDRIYRLEHAN